MSSITNVVGLIGEYACVPPGYPEVWDIRYKHTKPTNIAGIHVDKVYLKKVESREPD